MKYLIVLGLLTLGSGCASMPHKVFEEIHAGDTKAHVLDVMGEPSSFGASQLIPGATAWYYTSGHDQCGITLENDIVKQASCIKGQSRVMSALHGAAVGFQQGISAPQQSIQQSNYPTRCTSNTYGGQTYTDCR